MRVLAYIVAGLLILGCGAASYLITAAIVAVFCWCFSVTFSWKLALGIWLMIDVIKWLMNLSAKRS